MNIWFIILVGGLLTFLTRFLLIWLFNYVALPDWLMRALRFMPITVLSIIVFQDLAIRDNQVVLGLQNTRLLAGLVAAVIAWRTRNVMWTIALGMVTLWLMNYLLKLL